MFIRNDILKLKKPKQNKNTIFLTEIYLSSYPHKMYFIAVLSQPF